MKKTYVATYSRVPGGRLFTHTIEATDLQHAVKMIEDCASDLGPEIVAIYQMPRSPEPQTEMEK